MDMIGFPDYIKDPQKLKKKYEGVSTNSASLFQALGSWGRAKNGGTEAVRRLSPPSFFSRYFRSSRERGTG